MRVLEGVSISSDQFLSLLKIKKVNISSSENPKFSNIGDYWDDETIWNIIDLLHKFQDMFPTKIFKMKGIVRDLREIKIVLNTDTNHVKKLPYQLNPRYK